MSLTHQELILTSVSTLDVKFNLDSIDTLLCLTLHYIRLFLFNKDIITKVILARKEKMNKIIEIEQHFILSNEGIKRWVDGSFLESRISVNSGVLLQLSHRIPLLAQRTNHF